MASTSLDVQSTVELPQLPAPETVLLPLPPVEPPALPELPALPALPPLPTPALP